MAGNESLAGKDASWAAGTKRVIESFFSELDERFDPPNKKVSKKQNAAR